MKLPWHVIILFGCLNLSSPGFAQEHRRYENLGNPTEYLYHVSADRVKTALEIFAQDKSGDLKGGFLDDGQFGFDVCDYYTSRYWVGHREKTEDVVPPEAGRIGTIDAYFRSHIIPEGKNCRIKIDVHMFTQEVGRHYTLFPDFHKTGTRVDVKSDTYFEYSFLRRIGKLVGEKDMPPLNEGAENHDRTGNE